MPTYDYKCLGCGHKFEELQKMTDDPLKDCPECGGTLKRLIGTGATPIFKGSGFYQTDYKSGLSQKADTKKKVSNDAKVSENKKENKKTES